MKRIIILFNIISVFLLSCEDNRLEGMFDDRVLLLKNGKLQVPGLVNNDNLEIDVPVYRSGLSKDMVKVTVEIDAQLLKEYQNSEGQEFSLLPIDNFSLSSNTVVFEDDVRSVNLKLTIDINKLKNIQGLLDDKFAIPLVIKSDGVKVNNEKNKLLIIPVLTGGMSQGTDELLWSKTLTELGINQTDHFTASLAVTSQYLYVNTRNQDLRYYNRFTGEYVGSIVLPFKGSLTNFTVTNDEHDNLLISNLRNASGEAQQTIYKISNGGEPVVFIDAKHGYPNGRKISVMGDLNNNAIITSTVENSSTVLVWKVESGSVVSQIPETITLDRSKINWRTAADALPVSMNLDDGLFAVGYDVKSIMGYYGKDGNLIGEFDVNQLGVPSESVFAAQSLAMVELNSAKYLALAIQNGPTRMYSVLLDVTKLDRIGNVSTNSLVVYTSQPISTTNNANATADIQVRLADDKESFIMYSLGTNGSITATKFSQ